MTNLESFLEQTWDGILSRDPQRITQVFNGLSSKDQQVVLHHLRKMTSESGWHPEQVISAQTALDVLDREEGK
jgi:hypothetical protein